MITARNLRLLGDSLRALAGQDDIIMLRDHHRSHADIIEFSNRQFYEGRLRIATKYDCLRRPALDEPTVRWVDVQGVVTRPGSGALNETEARAMIAVARKLDEGVVNPTALPTRQQATADQR